MTEPLLSVRDFRTEENDPGEELLRNYEFNISQGIVQRVSRFFDSLALMEEPPARDAGDLVSTRNASGLSTGVSPDSARGGVMGFGRKRNVCNQEKSAHTVVWEKDEDMAALKVQVADLQALALVDPARKAAAEDAARMKARNRKEKEEAKDADMATLKALVAEMQAFVAPSAASRPIPCPRTLARPHAPTPPHHVPPRHLASLCPLQKVAAATAATAVAKAEAEAAADCTRWSKCLFPAASKEVEAGQAAEALVDNRDLASKGV